MKKVREVMTHNVGIINPDATLEAAATKMEMLGVGSLPVFDGDVLVGMLTDRDITVRAVASGLDAKTATVYDVMTPEVVFIFEDQSIGEAANLMAEKHIHRIVVLNRSGRLAGIVSVDDVAVQSGDARLAGETLERVAYQPKRYKPKTSDKPYEHIMIALDGSQLAEQVLPHVAPLAEKFGSRLTLLRAISPDEDVFLAGASVGAVAVGVPTTELEPLTQEKRLRASQYLETIKARLEARGLTVDCEQPEGLPPADIIVGRARRLGVDLIAMATHARSGVDRVVFGSVADAVLRSAPCPVLLVRANEKQ
jgi:nucleotide-binding universal stress UspA family protein/CBS domain-containing protein